MSTPLLKAEEAAAYLRVSRRQLYELTRRGELAHVRFGPKLMRWHQADLDAYVEAHRKQWPRSV